MRSRLGTVPDLFVFEGDRSGVTASQRAVKAANDSDSPSIGRDAYRLSPHESTAGQGSIVVGLVWLAFYVMAVVYSLISEPAPLTSTARPAAPIAIPAPR